MRIWGRVWADANDWTWVEITPDANGLLDNIRITNLIQVLLLCLDESPFWGNWGIPAEPTIVQQVFPDYYVAQIQNQFAPYFQSLIISKTDDPTPTYNIKIITNQGAVINEQVAGNDRFEFSPYPRA